MTKIAHILKETELKSLEKLSINLKKNDFKIAGKLYSALKTYCITRKIQMKLDPKGRIRKVLINVEGNLVLAKPIIQNNKLVFFYKKKYYSSFEAINQKIEYTCEMKK